MKNINIGIDFGRTIREYRVSIGGDYPDAIRVIKRLVTEIANKVYIVSKVNEQQKIDVVNWLNDNYFYDRTGILRQDVYFCAERKDKAPICNNLEITHFIDDRPEVMFHLNPYIRKFLFRPNPEDVVKYFNGLKNTSIVQSWKEIEDYFFH